MPVLTKVTEVEKINSVVNCFRLTLVEGMETVENWKHWYSDPSMMGRYFVVCRKSDTKIRRQYSVCNAVRHKF